VTNYQRGAAFEHRVKRDLEAHGYSVVRSAGSHSEADLVALGPLEPWVVQCKLNGYMTPTERMSFYAFCDKGRAVPIKASNVKHKIRYQRLLADCQTWDEVKP
jgi:Holliday junction resolvase